MRLSTKGRYSLEIVLYICLLSSEEYANVRSVAENTGISEGYLEQLFIPLRRAGIVKSIRGSRGGYLPAKPPEQITVTEILLAAEGSLEPASCVAKKKPCSRKKLCFLSDLWKELHKEIICCTDSITMADLVDAYKAMESPGYQI